MATPNGPPAGLAARLAGFLGLVACVLGPLLAPDVAAGIPAGGLPPAPTDDRNTPFARVFETGSSKGPLMLSEIAARYGWKAVPEGRLDYAFTGDVVLLNNVLTLVLREDPGLGDVYSQTPAGLKHRATVSPLPAGTYSHVRLTSVKILENSAGAVMVDAGYALKDGRKLSVRYRLTAGQAMLEIRPGDGMGKIYFFGSIRYVVVPDFFGDDMVFGGVACKRDRLGLPTENCVLSLLDGGDAMLMCLWKDAGQGAEIVHAQLPGRTLIAGCEIEAGKDKSLWLSLLEAPGIWQEQSGRSGGAGKPGSADWKPPFPAKWRIDHRRADGVTRSCWLPGEGEPGAAPVTLGDGLVLVYPLDRSRATPLTVSCPIDAMRNALGVGPCQYILEAEGLASPDAATPAQVMDWIENLFRKKKEPEAAEEIKERLRQMTDQVGRARARIVLYGGLAREVQTLCGSASGRNPAAEVARRLLPMAENLEQSAAEGLAASQDSERLAQLAGEIGGLVGKNTAPAVLPRLAAEVRGIGAAQDRALSRCRMTVRWLKHLCRMYAADDPGGADLAGKVQARAEQVLQGK